MLDTTAASSLSAASTVFFAHERASTSLQDLAIVRKIVEREGCLEALTQLLTTHARASSTHKTPTDSMAAPATLVAAPMVVVSLLDQLRGVSVDIVENIDQWKRAHRDHAVFQWRSLNYLAKMLCDTAFLYVHRATLSHLPAFHGLRLERNPLLAPLHLDHAALRDDGSIEMACRLALSVGSVDMKRVFHASRLLLQEQASLQGGPSASAQNETSLTSTLGIPTPMTRLHWSHRPMAMTLAPSASSPSLLRTSDPSDPRETMALDVALAKELVFQHEHELGAMREELAVLQRRLQTDLLLKPETKRSLQTRAAALNHDLKLRTGDLFHRRNELHRKAAVLRMDRRRRVHARGYYARPLPETETEPASPRDETHETDPIQQHFTTTATFRAALQADELRRHELVNAFAAFAKRQAAASVTKRKLQALSSTTPTSRTPLRVASPSPVRSCSSAGSSQPGPKTALMPAHSVSIEMMTPVDVEQFVAALPLGDDATRYGALLRAKGIDGKLLAQAQSSDLEELGVTTRLHRVKIVEAVQQALSASTG